MWNPDISHPSPCPLLKPPAGKRREKNNTKVLQKREYGKSRSALLGQKQLLQWTEPEWGSGPLCRVQRTSSSPESFFSSPVWGFSLPSTGHITSSIWEYRKGRMHLGGAEDHRPDVHHCRMLPSFFGFWKFLCSRLASTGGHIYCNASYQTHCRVSESLSF